MKQKTKILLSIAGVTVLAAIVVWILGRNPILAIVVGLLVFFLIYALWDMPPKHKDFSYEDQQRTFRAFDRSDMIDLGIPKWARGRNKKKGKK
jgi:4-hydroxybenzoate polyprenyltransferase